MLDFLGQAGHNLAALLPLQFGLASPVLSIPLKNSAFRFPANTPVHDLEQTHPRPPRNAAGQRSNSLPHVPQEHLTLGIRVSYQAWATRTMAKLTSKQRKALPAGDFAGPGRSYPIENKSHAAKRYSLRYADG